MTVIDETPRFIGPNCLAVKKLWSLTRQIFLRPGTNPKIVR
jgi:hypothetical protein